MNRYKYPNFERPAILPEFRIFSGIEMRLSPEGQAWVDTMRGQGFPQIAKEKISIYGLVVDMNGIHADIWATSGGYYQGKFLKTHYEPI